MFSTTQLVCLTGKDGMPTLKDTYLVIYNVSCAFGWGYVLFACIRHVMEGRNEPQALYNEVEQVLQVVQTAALMEVGVARWVGRLSCAAFAGHAPFASCVFCCA